MVLRYLCITLLNQPLLLLEIYNVLGTNLPILHVGLMLSTHYYAKNYSTIKPCAWCIKRAAIALYVLQLGINTFHWCREVTL